MPVQTQRKLQAIIHELHRIYEMIARHLLLELQRRLIIRQRHACPRIVAIEIACAAPKIAAARETVDPVLVEADDVFVLDISCLKIAAQACAEIDTRMTERPIFGIDREITIVRGQFRRAFIIFVIIELMVSEIDICRYMIVELLLVVEDDPCVLVCMVEPRRRVTFARIRRLGQHCQIAHTEAVAAALVLDATVSEHQVRR